MTQSSFLFDETEFCLDQSWIVRAEYDPSTLITLSGSRPYPLTPSTMSDCSRVTDTDTALFISNALLEMSNSQLLWVWTFRFFAQPVSYRQLRDPGKGNPLSGTRLAFYLHPLSLSASLGHEYTIWAADRSHPIFLMLVQSKLQGHAFEKLPTNCLVSSNDSKDWISTKSCALVSRLDSRQSGCEAPKFCRLPSQAAPDMEKVKLIFIHIVYVRRLESMRRVRSNMAVEKIDNAILSIPHLKSRISDRVTKAARPLKNHIRRPGALTPPFMTDKSLEVQAWNQLAGTLPAVIFSL
ncbi:unnamed protein product [Fusarium graminearum]|nr:unnamed protein product [Fusarium graminearum]CAG1990706.1 unnamed protein product [Fusarium graminearum]VTO91035.1 unnamed protein product [Fusarium graminearum]